LYNTSAGNTYLPVTGDQMTAVNLWMAY